jgi:hypothetical protein
MTTYIVQLHCQDCGREEFIRTVGAWHPRLDTVCRRCRRTAERQAQRLREEEIRAFRPEITGEVVTKFSAEE